LKISAGFERLFIFAMGFFMMAHIVSCVWVMVALLEDSDEGKETWLTGFGDYTTTQMYFVSFYFVSYTITTVGYGDIPVLRSPERIFCSLMMILGVVAFSFASGSLASILQNYDNHSANLQEKMTTLDRILKDYEIPKDLY
jgi:hypothetical protein